MTRNKTRDGALSAPVVLIHACERRGMELFGYLRHVLRRIADHPMNRPCSAGTFPLQSHNSSSHSSAGGEKSATGTGGFWGYIPKEGILPVFSAAYLDPGLVTAYINFMNIASYRHLNREFV
ncbi:MAG TPA: hypothetical protein PLQ35_17215 [bacterium]|nr:hypothetical protein [bacterium]HQL64019.1 hypothetical protein [bacterium]